MRYTNKSASDLIRLIRAAAKQHKAWSKKPNPETPPHNCGDYLEHIDERDENSLMSPAKWPIL
jgi:hypothetical protein